jgi:hypothetical protein
VVDFTGVGPLTLGGSLSAEKTEVTGYGLQPASECPNPATSIFSWPQHPTLWLQVDGAGSDRIALVSLGYDGNYSPSSLLDSPKTAQGIGIGSTVAGLLAAYPGIVSDPEGGIQYYVLGNNAGGYLDFATTDGLVIAITAQENTQHVTEFCG